LLSKRTEKNKNVHTTTPERHKQEKGYTKNTSMKSNGDLKEKKNLDMPEMNQAQLAVYNKLF
jgi:hypothetical protein